jgi:hypothetical protein
MALVEIPLNSFRYRFRRLTWREEIRIPFTPAEDHRKTLLIHALSDISGMPVESQDDARKILNQLPEKILSKIWVLYRGNGPEERYYTSRGLYDAPDQKVFVQRVQEQNEAVGRVADRATEQMERRFGAKELAEAREVESRMVEAVKKQGKLVRA